MARSTIESEIQEHLRRLCEDIGPRPIGSAGDHEAAGYIQSVFRSAGLEVEEQRFECPDWQDEGTQLETAGRSLPAWTNSYSPSCEISAPSVALCTVAELEAANLEGKIGLLYGDLTAQPLTPKGCTVYNPERDQRIIALLEKKQPAALITVRPRNGLHTRIIEDWDFRIPSATVSPEVGLALLERPGAVVRLRIATRTGPGHSAHLVGHLPGAREERIVVCAHYDTKVDTPGALDNGAGVAALLALAQQMAGRKLPVGIEFIAFSAEEYGGSLDDSEYYVRVAGDRLGTMLAAINMDGIGYRLGTNTVALMAGSEPFQAELDRLLAGYPGVIWTEPWPQSNHSTFAMRGVPAVAFTSTGAWDLAHQPADTIEWVGLEKVAEVVSLAGEIVESLQDRPLHWTRPPA